MRDAPEGLRDDAVKAVERLQAAGHTAYWAGGCVRDMLLGTEPRDYDIATDADPDAVLTLFAGSTAVGKSFGVVVAPVGNGVFEIATFREDHGIGDGRRPLRVSFTNATLDARRRDFTINAIFYDPVGDRIYDYVEGRRDIDAKLVRSVGDPAHRFREDHLRMLRAVRFACTLGFEIEDGTAGAIRQLAPAIVAISAERIREELSRSLLEAPRAGRVITLMDELGLLEPILPEVAAMKGQAQPPQFHPEGDVFQHTVQMLDLMENADRRLVFAALLHDVGKPPTARQAEDRIRFDGHAPEGAGMTASILRRLKFPTDEADAIVRCIRNHMRFLDVQRMKRSTLRRFVGSADFPLEMALHRLDCLASHGSLDNYDFLRSFEAEMANEPVLPDPWVTGHDILALGVPEGPEVGRWHRRAYDAQLEERFSGRDALLQWLKGEIERDTPSP